MSILVKLMLILTLLSCQTVPPTMDKTGSFSIQCHPEISGIKRFRLFTCSFNNLTDTWLTLDVENFQFIGNHKDNIQILQPSQLVGLIQSGWSTPKLRSLSFLIRRDQKDETAWQYGESHLQYLRTKIPPQSSITKFAIVELLPSSGKDLMVKNKLGVKQKTRVPYQKLPRITQFVFKGGRTLDVEFFKQQTNPEMPGDWYDPTDYR